MTTQVQEAPAPPLGDQLVHVPDANGELQALAAQDAAQELADMQDDLDMARAVLARAKALDDALRVVVPVGASLALADGSRLTMVQPEGNRYVDPEVLADNGPRLVALGLAEEVPPSDEVTYQAKGVAALSKPDAMAKLTAAGLTGLVKRREGTKTLVLTPAESNEEAA